MKRKVLRLKLFTIGISIGIHALSGGIAYALPLLSENASRDYISDIGLAIYPDSSDPNKFYYFPLR